MTNNKQSGFGVVAIIAAIVVVAILGYAGYRLYTSQANKPASTSNTTTSNQTTNNTQNSNTQTNNTQNTATYLDIKELGIKITLSDSIKDATYYYSSQHNSQSDPQQVSLSTKSLTDASGGSCSASGAAGGLGTIIKTSNQNLTGAPLVPNGSTIFKLGNNYFYYTASGAPCSTSSSISTLLSDQRSALHQAFATIQLDN